MVYNLKVTKNMRVNKKTTQSLMKKGYGNHTSIENLYNMQGIKKI